jgi:hypothetical protein
MSLEPDQPHHEHHKTGLSWVDLAIALSALLISMTSLIVTIVHSRALERMADANAQLVQTSSWPFVAYHTSNTWDDGRSLELGIENEGVGPAKIESVEIKWKGVPRRNAVDLLGACCGLKYNPGIGLLKSTMRGLVLRAGASVHFLILPRSPLAGDTVSRLNEARNSSDLTINVCYCSVFDQCWTTDVARYSLNPRPVEKCVPPAIGYDL